MVLVEQRPESESSARACSFDMERFLKWRAFPNRSSPGGRGRGESVVIRMIRGVEIGTLLENVPAIGDDRDGRGSPKDSVNDNGNGHDAMAPTESATLSGRHD